MRPRVGFLGTGWIGRHRMQAMVDSEAISAVAFCDPDEASAAEAAAIAPGARRCSSLEKMLGGGLDGVVIATPSALHAAQSIRALEAGAAVFCQKPLARTAAEAEAVIAAAARADRLLGVDFSYRHLRAVEMLRELIAGGDIGVVHAIDLTFHNAHGPDKPWFRQRALAGGGCLIDLGSHMLDLVRHCCGEQEIGHVAATLMADGSPVFGDDRVEDLAFAQLTLASGAGVRLACSWNLHAGREAVIEARFIGATGALLLTNVGGSFYDFVLERHRGTVSETLVEPPDEWGSRAAAEWACRLAQDRGFDRGCRSYRWVSDAIDAIYAAAAIRATRASAFSDVTG